MEKEKQYDLIQRQAKALAEEEPWYIALFANLSALIYETLEEINWAGFYVVRGGQLVLGPFQGKAACIHIPEGKGVCGTAIQKDETILVSDVHQFPGHIACDSASNSEIVLPIHAGGRVKAVLDIDSPMRNRFDAEDQRELEALIRVLEEQVLFE